MKSMTGFASGKGTGAGMNWTWDIRAVNSRGMDARLRLPDWINGLEQLLRGQIKKNIARGNINLTLKVVREDQGQGAQINAQALGQMLEQIKTLQQAADQHGLTLAPSTATEILQMPGMTGGATVEVDNAELSKALSLDFSTLLKSLNDMRQSEGSALHGVISDQLDQIEILVGQAGEQADSRLEATAQTLKDNLALVLQNADAADPDRVAQELAIIAVKADVKEEIDRLNTHVAAAREMLNAKGPVGRKLDFLTQEFNREANTLCSKAQSKELTRTGLELKAIIEQMREQVQNVE